MCWLMQACLHIDPAKRLTCSELLRLPYLTGVENTIPNTILKAQVTTTHADHALLIPAWLLSGPLNPDHRLHWQQIGDEGPSGQCKCCAQEKASEERELLVKMRRQKRKSAEVEPEAPARPVFNLTASAHASQPDAARCAIRSTLPLVESLVASPMEGCCTFHVSIDEREYVSAWQAVRCWRCNLLMLE